jgi:hypothetical protein
VGQRLASDGQHSIDALSTADSACASRYLLMAQCVTRKGALTIPSAYTIFNWMLSPVVLQILSYKEVLRIALQFVQGRALQWRSGAFRGTTVLYAVLHPPVQPHQYLSGNAHRSRISHFPLFLLTNATRSVGMATDYFKNPPPGLDLTESRTASNNAIGIVLFILSLIFVALRLFVRLRLKHEPLGLDDYLMFLGLALNAGNLACCIAGGFFGLGKHIWSLDPYQMRQITIVRLSRTVRMSELR